MTLLKHVGRHLEDLADGRVIVPGQTIDLDTDQAADPHNQRLVADGILVAAQTDTDVSATDEAKQLAAQHGVDLHEVTPSGKDGRVLKSDVETHIEKEGND